MLQLGLILTGFSGSLIGIPSLSEMMEAVEEDEIIVACFSRRKIEETVSSYFATF